VRAVLLLAFGGPSSLVEVESFLSLVLKGAKPSSEQVKRVKDRYRLIGGSSPIKEITFNQARLLEEGLNSKGYLVKSYIGMRYSHPFIEESLREILEDGIKEVIAIPMTPFRSSFTTEAYKGEINRINEGLKERLNIHFKDGWHSHTLFLEAISETIFEGLLNFDNKERRGVHIIFTAHSLPESILDSDSYISDMKETVYRVLERIGSFHWHMAFQSRGIGEERWIGPDLGSVLFELARIKVKEILVVPIGFVTDNIEVLYDIDIFYRKKAEDLGINLRRTRLLNFCERFIEFLANLVIEELGKGLN